ncbi:Pyrimidine-specific ribonucleoside hydrolase rihA [uncultured Flavonifractor sp.]|nr:pyrimidine-specific ribonucleoside hydrolase RihA [Oscillospiraceae bacterium]CUQ61693.1 ribosylpyrimidine nucleosidase [Flavonifractor plautii]SCJ57783.1 Pyrimidine-specific ribonucleoside hydrolase rihA [uncultured Flavonifractor sp.]
MERRPVFIDCDPGIDDAVALMMAFQAAELDVRGISAVAGNVGLERTLGNALKIVELSGAAAPVYAGADRPMFGAPIAAEHFHGEDGLLGAELPAPVRMPEAGPAWEALRREAEAWGGALEVVATGPLTNLGIALSLYPELAGLVRCVTMMGGAAAFGNTTPAAEFNVLADPEAAELVFRSGIPVVMCGLDVTHSTYITAREVEELAALGSVQARLAAYFMGSGIEENARQFRTGGAPLHDPCAMMYAIDRSLFESKPCWIGVERHGKVTRGKTVTDAYSDAKRTANARLVTGSDREGFIRRMMELFVGYGSEMPDEKF